MTFVSARTAVLLATASGGGDRGDFGDARLCDTATGQPLTRWLRHNNDVFAVRFSPDAQQLWTTCWDGRLRAFRVSKEVDPEAVGLAVLPAGGRVGRPGHLRHERISDAALQLDKFPVPRRSRAPADE